MIKTGLTRLVPRLSMGQSHQPYVNDPKLAMRQPNIAVKKYARSKRLIKDKIKGNYKHRTGPIQYALPKMH